MHPRSSFTPAGVDSAHENSAAVSVTVTEEDIRRLQVLAAAGGVGESGGGSFAELLSAILHRGIDESYRGAGLASVESGRVEAVSVAPEDKPAATGSTRRTSRRGVGRAVLIAAAAATVVIVAGSYAAHWTWTGFAANGQVWDWMQLLLLPVAIGTFPLWLRYSGQMSPTRRKALGTAGLALTAFVAVGYLVPLRWTGFRGHTLWNWLTLVVLPITITSAAVWPKTGRGFRPFYWAAAGALGVAWVVTLIGGYAGHWAWTGYPGNTLWDWVKLFLAPIAITTFVVPELVNLLAGNVGHDGLPPTADAPDQRPRAMPRDRVRLRSVPANAASAAAPTASRSV